VKQLFALSALALLAVTALPAHAGAIRNATDFNDFTLARNDDGSTGPVGLGFNVNFFGLSRSSLFVNNNGNVTFDSPLSTFTPFSLSTTARQIIAPFFADVDTRGPASTQVRYGTEVIDGRKSFGVNWIDVGYFSFGTDKLNSFQLIMTERADIAAGDFDFEFNYDSITWETGGASGGSGGLGGSSARVGWSNGNAATFELGGSAVNGALLNGGANSLVRGSLNSGVAGRYIFNVRNGVIVDPGTVPVPTTLLLVGLGLVAAGAMSRRK
jgi:hypothetical protein